MTRNVRNFWITLDVDGKQAPIATGPRARDGGFSLTVRMRNKGEVLQALNIEGYVSDDSLVLRVERDGYAACVDSIGEPIVIRTRR